MKEQIKKWLLGFVLTAVFGGAVYLANLDGRLWKSADERIEIVSKVKAFPDPVDAWKTKYADSTDKAQAQHKRMESLKSQQKADSSRIASDSIMLEYVKRIGLTQQVMSVRLDSVIKSQ